MALFIPILEALANHIAAASYFADIPVVAIGVGKDAATHIEERIKRNLQKTGISVELAIIRAIPEANTPGPYFSTIEIIARIIENPVVNLAKGGTTKPAFDVAEYVCALVHLPRAPDAAAALNQILFTTNLVGVADEQFHIFDVMITAHGGIEITTP